MLPGLHILLGGLESTENSNTDHCTGLPLVGLEIPPSLSSPCCMLPVVPWWDAVLVLVILVSPFLLDFLFWSVPVCCHPEQTRVIVSAATQLVLYTCVSALHTRRVSCIPVFCYPAEQPVLPAHLFSALWLCFLRAKGPVHLSMPSLFMSVVLHLSLRGQVVPLVSPCQSSRHSFLLCRGPQIISSLLMPSILQHGEDLLSSQILTCLIPSSTFPLILFYHRDNSEAMWSRCYDP